MRLPEISKRVDKLTNTLTDEPKEHIARFDIESFTEPEKLLFLKIDELLAIHGNHLPPDVLEANKDLILKSHRILFRYAVETFRFAMHCFLNNPKSQRDKDIFDTFFYSFMLEQNRCLKEAQAVKSEEEFFNLMEKYDFLGKLRYFVDKSPTPIEKKENTIEKIDYSEDEDNEHYDRV
jgi:hypothetical protein